MINFLRRRKSLTFKLTLLVLLFAIYLFAPQILIFIFPGILFFFYEEFDFGLFNKFFYSIAFSTAYWIVTFWLLKYIPIPFSTYLNFSFLIFFVSVILMLSKKITLPTRSKKDLFSFVFMLILTILLTPIYTRFSVPAGADMATHTYIAKLIYEKDTFPKSYEPLAPSENFGSAPFGMSILIAGMAKLSSSLTIPKIALLITVFIYLLYGAGIFILLKRYFPGFVSFITTFSLFWFGRNLLLYPLWGGNPTILSIAFLLMAFNFTLEVVNHQRFNVIGAVIIAFLCYASFTTHQIPLVTFGYLSLLIVLIEFRNLKKVIRPYHIKLFLGVVLILFVLSLPFWKTFNPPTVGTINYIRNWQKSLFVLEKEENINNTIHALALFIKQSLGGILIFMGLAGILISVNRVSLRKRQEIWALALVIFTIVLIANSLYWIFPLSPLLYPDRLITIGTIPFSFFIAIFVNESLKTFPILLRIKNFRLINLVFTTAVIGTFIFSFINNFEWFYRTYELQISVTEDDLEMFRWISLNTTAGDVIQNNYGDAGVWIPTYTYRKITSYDATPYDILSIRDAAKNLKPSYLFLGSKQVYSDIHYRFSELMNNPNYEAVARSGNSWIFKIKNVYGIR